MRTSLSLNLFSGSGPQVTNHCVLHHHCWNENNHCTALGAPSYTLYVVLTSMDCDVGRSDVIRIFFIQKPEETCNFKESRIKKTKIQNECSINPAILWNYSAEVFFTYFLIVYSVILHSGGTKGGGGIMGMPPSQNVFPPSFPPVSSWSIVKSLSISLVTFFFRVLTSSV